MNALPKYKVHKKFIYLILLCLIFLSPNLYLVLVKLFQANLFEFLREIYSLLITLGIVLFLPVFFRISLKKYFLSLTPLGMALPCVMFGVILYHKTPSRWMFYYALNASSIEIREFISGLFWWKLLFIATPISTILLSLRLTSTNYISTKQAKNIFLITFIFLLGFSWIFKSIQHRNIFLPPKVVFRTTFKDTPVYSLIRLTKALRTKNNADYTLDMKPTVVHVSNNTELAEVHVLIIGESSRYGNWNINGYERQTSPNLNDLGGLYSYTNVISPSFVTSSCLPLMLTTLGLSNETKNEDKLSVLSLFKAAGYTTTWIANQKYAGGSIENLVHQADNLMILDCRPQSCLDMQLVKTLKKIEIKDKQKHFIVLHTKGSHYPYYNRYPKEFEFFTPAFERNKHIISKGRQKNKLINSYDNSILYTDHIISLVASHLTQDSLVASLVFVSDHGENLFDSDLSGFGRDLNGISPTLYHVPFFVWLSDRFQETNGELSGRIEANSDRELTTENMIYTLVDIAGIQWNKERNKLSFFSDSNLEYSRHVLTNKDTVLYKELFSD